MKNEIKEILNELKNEDNYIEDYGFKYKRISLDNVWYLLDYITNLQNKIDISLNYINKHPVNSCYYLLDILQGDHEL